MVAVIKSGNSLHRVFNYNENKVKEGVARCILAVNYPIDLEKLTLNQKLNRLLNQAQLNENVKRNSIHISLNFAVGEQLEEAALKFIAAEYMERIGFGEQPYLVYQHHDAAHPHLHIISTKVQADGSRIDTQNIGKNKSEPARKAIEEKYNLVKAEQHRKHQFTLSPIQTEEIVYGKSPTKRAISNVLDAVLNSYQYTSIPELNALLKNYHVYADRGKEGSRTFQFEGLNYGLLDGNGNRIGVPIKASLFHQNPGLKFLEKRFQTNIQSRKLHQNGLKRDIESVLKLGVVTINALENALQKKQIQLVCRTNAQGVIYGLTYIDHRRKCVFNGSALGKNFSAKAILNKIEVTDDSSLKAHKESLKSGEDNFNFHEKLQHSEPQFNHFLESLLAVEKTYETLPYQLKKSRKKKKRRNRNTSL
jgi:hypothetical protein